MEHCFRISTILLLVTQSLYLFIFVCFFSMLQTCIRVFIDVDWSALSIVRNSILSFLDIVSRL
jgi:hypothetical protein